MEKEGIRLALSALITRGVKITRLITDQHLPVQKWMCETYSAIDHRYDAWHVTNKGKYDLRQRT